MNKLKLYLDVCTLCRPFDDQNRMRIRLETDSYYLIMQPFATVIMSCFTLKFMKRKLQLFIMLWKRPNYLRPFTKMPVHAQGILSPSGIGLKPW